MNSVAMDRRQRRRNIQVALSIFPSLYLLVGAAFLFQQPTRTSGPAFLVARDIPGSMHTWGVAFISLGLMMTVAVSTSRRNWITAALVVGAFLVGFWAYLIFRAALDSPLVSWTGPAWIGFACAAHLVLAFVVARNDVLR